MPVLFPHIICLRQAVKIVDEMHHFFILLIIIERNDRNAIIDLECKTIYTVVNDDYVLEVPVLEDPKIFDIVPLLSKEAMLSIEAMSYELVIWIYIV